MVNHVSRLTSFQEINIQCLLFEQMYKDLYPKRWQWHFVYALIFSIHRTTSQKQIYLGILMWNKIS